jgi:hypothetical protein
MKTLKQLPTLEQLKAGEVEFSPLKTLLNQEPAKEWLKELPDAKTKNGEPIYFLPIERIDYLLNSIFASSWIEILDTNLTQNSIVVSVRLLYVNPETGRVEHTDGVGAANSRLGIEQAAPIAESLAKKNAAKKLGRLFGRDLSRDLTEPEKAEQPKENKLEEIIELPENPVRARILTQIRKSKTLQGLRNTAAAIEKRLESEEITQQEFEILTAELEKKIEFLKK